MGSRVARSHDVAHSVHSLPETFGDPQSESRLRSCPSHLYTQHPTHCLTHAGAQYIVGGLNKFELRKFHMSLFYLQKSMTLNSMLLKKLIPRYLVAIFLTYS